jgi:DNA repair photolyase
MRPVDNPPNPYLTQAVEWLDDAPEMAKLHVHEEHAKSLLSRNDSPDLPFRYSINPYRGCFHACAYCYARPSHQYLGFGAGTDFERELVVKLNAPELLAAELAKPAMRGQPIAISGNTDCYQPLEASYGLTRRCLQVCVEHAQPVAIITKGALVQRDIDVLQALATVSDVRVYISLTFAEDDMARKLEPGASAPSKRLKAMAALSAAGIETAVAIAPVIPGLNDADIPELLKRARDAGATRAFMTLLRLPSEVKPVFAARLRECFPARADKVLHALQDMRDGKLNDPRFGARMVGSGARYSVIEQLFKMHCERLGLITTERAAPPVPAAPAAKPTKRQLTLF